MRKINGHRKLNFIERSENKVSLIHEASRVGETRSGRRPIVI